MSIYGRKGAQLNSELIQNDDDRLPRFNILADNNWYKSSDPFPRKDKGAMLETLIAILETISPTTFRAKRFKTGLTRLFLKHFLIFGEMQNDLFDQVAEEANEHYFQLESRMVKMQEEGLDIETTQNKDYYGALVHHLCLVRNKRCLMAYIYNRSQRIQRLRWQLGAVLPSDIQDKLSFSEKDFFKNYSNLLGSYMASIDLDLTVDATPPKDPYIQVRVMDDVGEVMLDDQSTSLLKNSIHLMKRTEAESLVSQGVLEEFLE